MMSADDMNRDLELEVEVKAPANNNTASKSREDGKRRNIRSMSSLARVLYCSNDLIRQI
jgi:hypothetical protein